MPGSKKPTSQKASQPASQSASQLASKPAIQQARQPASKPASQQARRIGTPDTIWHFFMAGVGPNRPVLAGVGRGIYAGTKGRSMQSYTHSARLGSNSKTS